MSSRARLVGRSIPRLEDPKYLTGRGCFVADISLPGMVHVAFLRSPHAHARFSIKSVEAAAAMPNVLAVLTGDELRRLDIHLSSDVPTVVFQALACDEVHYVGEPLAAVAARTRHEAEDAVERIEVEYEPLAAVVDPLEAARDGSAVSHACLSSNVYFQQEQVTEDLRRELADADLVLRQTFYSSRLAVQPLEPRGAIASWSPGLPSLTLHVSNQWPHFIRDQLADALHLPYSAVRVITPDVGGGFGVKAVLYPEDIVVSHLSMTLGHPVKWISDRMESLLADTQARDSYHIVEAAFSRTGEFRALYDHMVAPAGAYPIPVFSGAILETVVATMVASGPYKLRHYGYKIDGVLTNTAPTCSYRGVGATAATWVYETMMDLAADALNLDRVAIRLANMVKSEEFPYHAATGVTYDPGSYQESLTKAAERIDYSAFLRRQEHSRQSGRLIGLGVASFVEETALGVLREDENILLPYEAATLRMEPSGHIVAQVGVSSHGQGHATTLAQLIGEELGLPAKDVTVLHGDTVAAPYGGGTVGSRSATMGGGACILAARDLRAKLERVAAHRLEVDREDVELVDGYFRIRGASERALTLREVARVTCHLPALLPDGMEPGLEITRRYVPPPLTFSNGCHAAIVEIDPDTFTVRVLRYVVVEDCGTVINPMIVEGQIMGGVAQGIGSALMERVVYAPDGQNLTLTWADYKLPTAVEIPNVEVDHLETFSANPGGIKGMGEGPLIASPAALALAIRDALKPLAVTINRLPASPEELFAMVVQARESRGAASPA